MNNDKSYKGMLRGIKITGRILPVLYVSIILKTLSFLCICLPFIINKGLTRGNGGGIVYALLYFGPLLVISAIIFCISLFAIFQSRKVKTDNRTKLIRAFFIDLVITVICFSSPFFA